MARILIVDDEQSERLILEQVLMRGGHDVYVASDGEQGYKTYLKNGIETIITDLNMPNVDGLEFIALLEGLFPDTPVIAVSGSGEGALAAAERMGAFAALNKPVDPEELLKTIAEAAPDILVP
jgi:DNA-binding NtrC family response regulator